MCKVLGVLRIVTEFDWNLLACVVRDLFDDESAHDFRINGLDAESQGEDELGFDQLFGVELNIHSVKGILQHLGLDRRHQGVQLDSCKKSIPYEYHEKEYGKESSELCLDFLLTTKCELHWPTIDIEALAAIGRLRAPLIFLTYSH